jgi:hypothetical protein
VAEFWNLQAIVQLLAGLTIAVLGVFGLRRGPGAHAAPCRISLGSM